MTAMPLLEDIPEATMGFWKTARQALGIALKNFNPVAQLGNPVLFMVWCSAAVSTIATVAYTISGRPSISGGTVLPPSFDWAITFLLWMTVLAANLAQALAEGRGRSHAAALRAMRAGTLAHRVERYNATDDKDASDAKIHDVHSPDLEVGDVVVLEANDIVPTDGQVIWGVALVDESAITGESAAVIREAGGDRSTVTGGTKVLSDRLVVRVTAPAGATVVDRMITLAEAARRHKPPAERALMILLVSFSLSFVLSAITLNAIVAPDAAPVSVPILASIVVVLVPAEIAALLYVTGIASRYRLLRNNVLVTSSEALETAGDITTLVVDKTGTITEGDRKAIQFIPLKGVALDEMIRTSALASIADATTEGASLLALAETNGFAAEAGRSQVRSCVPFSAHTRLSGCDLEDGTSIRKGAESAVLAWLKHVGTQPPRAVIDELRSHTDAIATVGGTPLVIAVKPPEEPGRVLGVIPYGDVIKPGIPARIEQLRSLGVKTVMVTGDNPLTAKAIAREAGIDDYLGDAMPEDKLELIQKEQADGHFVAMTGDGTNDAPALAQADVAVAMHSATTAARETANMIVLDDDPTKVVEIIATGRNQMATRGALATFNVANDVIRYFTFFPPLFVGLFPGLDALNILRLHSPASALMSTVIYSVAVIGILIPLGLAGVPYRLKNLGRAINLNLIYYGIGGLILPIICIKLIDLLVALIPGY